MATCSGPGAADEFDPWDLDDVLTRVVGPVVSSLFRPSELGGTAVGWGAALSRNETDPDLWVRVEVCGEVWAGSIWWGSGALDESVGDVAWRLADYLEDWLCECVFWGEQRLADVVVPAR